MTRTTTELPSAPPDGSDVARRLGLAAGVATALLLVVGLLLVHVLDGSALVGADADAVEGVAERRTGWLDTVSGVVDFLADTWWVVGLSLAAAVVSWRASRSWVAPLAVATAVFGEKAIYLLVSIVVGRDRPEVEPLGHVYATMSFPSGHVGAACTLYGVIALLVLADGRAPRPLQRAVVVVAVVVPLAVAFARIYRGVHFPTDVVAGWVLGTGWLLATWRALVVPSVLETRARQR